MVKALYGKCNGRDIVFSPDAAGRWETAVPASPNAAYIIELWAEDDAGNKSYFATVRVEYDTSQLCMTVQIVDIGVGWDIEDVRGLFSVVPVLAESDDEAVQSSVFFDSETLSEVIRCEVCGR